MGHDWIQLVHGPHLDVVAPARQRRAYSPVAELVRRARQQPPLAFDRRGVATESVERAGEGTGCEAQSDLGQDGVQSPCCSGTS